MARRPMETLVKPELTFGWVVKWKSSLNFVRILVNDVISTFVTYTSNTLTHLLRTYSNANATRQRVGYPPKLLKIKIKRYNCYLKNFFHRLSANCKFMNLWIFFSILYNSISLYIWYTIYNFICNRKVLAYFDFKICKSKMRQENVKRSGQFSNLGDSVRIVPP